MIGALRVALANFRARRGMFLASGLAFNFVVCLIPLLFFVVSVAGFVLSRRAVMEAVLNQLSAIVPVYKDELHQNLAVIIRRRRLSGLLGTAVLLLFASQLFNSIRLVLSDIFGFRGGPGFLRGMLRDAVAKGYKDVEHLRTNKDLDPLREREDFKKVVAELEAAKEAPPKKP